MIKFKNPFFIDSGAHGLYNEFVLRQGHKSGYEWFTTKEFYAYIDRFAEFVKTYPELKNFANVDVIFNPELTWKSQKYMEKVHNLHPIPVIHFGTPKKWLLRYLRKNYPYIALGGLGQEAQQSDYASWADEMFGIICDTPDRTPRTKVHGFAMTSWYLMQRYPWWSVDSTTWLSLAMYGQLIIPAYERGEWRYDKPFSIVRVSEISSKTKRQVAGKKMDLVLTYIKEKGFELGVTEIVDDKPVVITPGVQNTTNIRGTLNALYFLDFAKSRPKWPWSFYNQKKLL